MVMSTVRQLPTTSVPETFKGTCKAKPFENAKEKSNKNKITPILFLNGG